MSRCIIHIGMHKTGSTSIQHSLNGFEDDHFYYARLDMPNHSLAMFSLFSPHPERHHIHLDNGIDAAGFSSYITRMRNDLERSISAAGSRTLIISGEDISTIPRDGLTRMRDYLSTRFTDLMILGYVRPPSGYLASGFQQRVKSGSALVFNPAREYRSYMKRFSKFDDVFGRERVKLWKFDPAAFPGGCAVRDFCERSGIRIPRKRIVRMNDSLPREVVALLFTYRRFAQKLGYSVMRAPEGQRLGDRLIPLGKTRFRLSPKVVEPVLRQYRDDIQWMEARLGQSLQEDLGKPQPADIACEADLLKHEPDTVRKLFDLLGTSAPKHLQGKTAEEVAQLIHALRLNASTRFGQPGNLRKLKSALRTVLRLGSKNA